MFEKFTLRNRKGFTLVELALVLVIVGLLITGVLKGEALIQNARMKRLVNEKESISAAYFTFYDRYGQFPGDENLSGTPTSDAHDGNGNGQVVDPETGYVFEDLALAQIISGNYTGAATSLPTNTYGGTITVLWVGALSSNCIRMTLVPPDVAEQIDRKFDDGTYNTGTVRSNAAYGGTATLTVTWRM